MSQLSRHCLVLDGLYLRYKHSQQSKFEAEMFKDAVGYTMIEAQELLTAINAIQYSSAAIAKGIWPQLKFLNTFVVEGYISNFERLFQEMMADSYSPFVCSTN